MSRRTAGIRVSDMLFDERDLARRARTTLAAADHAVVSTAVGLGCRPHRELVPVYDHDGEPVLIVSRHSPAAAAARASRLVSVSTKAPCAQRARCPHAAASPEAAGVRLRLDGRLRLAAPGRRPSGLRPGLTTRGGNPLAVMPQPRADQLLVMLQVDDVHAGCPYDYPGSIGIDRSVPLELYAQANPDYIAAHAPRLARYLNIHHAGQLRDLAAAIAARDPSELAAAIITDLGPAAARLRYLDTEGSHETRMPIDPPSPSVEHLAAVLAAWLRDPDGASDQ